MSFPKKKSQGLLGDSRTEAGHVWDEAVASAVTGSAEVRAHTHDNTLT